MDVEAVDEQRPKRSNHHKHFLNMSSVGNLFSTTPKVSGFDVMEDEEKDDMLRKMALMLAEQNEEEFAKREWKSVVTGLRTDEGKGLTSEEAQQRLDEYGTNELPKEPPRSCFMLFLDQLNDLLVIMLIAAAIVAGALSQVAASVAIVVIITANAVLGVNQEMSAASALDELAAGEGTAVKVIRDGEEKFIPSEQVVPGDIVLLKLGEQIPADMRIIQSADFTVKEMNLTGESRPVKKNPRVMDRNAKVKVETEDEKDENSKGEKKEKALILSNFLYSSCDVLTGKCKAVVVKTGINTYVGRIFELIKNAKEDKESGEKSPLKEKLEKLGQKLGFASLFISLIVFLVGVTTDPCRGCDPDSDQPAWLQMLLVSVSLTVAAVPESLPVCVTLTLALGMRHMAKKKALVRRLLSVETLGSADIICTDKTGTLTAGVMTAITYTSGFRKYEISGAGRQLEGYHAPTGTDLENKEALEQAHEAEQKSGFIGQTWAGYAMCANAKIMWDEKENKWTFEGDPTETALVIAARKLGIQRDDFKTQWPRVHENPFNSIRKMMSVLVKKENPKNPKWFEGAPYVAIVKGASEQVLRKCVKCVDRSGKVVPLTDERRAELQRGIDGFASRSLRVLAVAYKTFSSKPADVKPENLEGDLTILAFAGLMDPVRPGVKDAIRTASGAGIRTVMITGDYAKTAKAIAKNIDIIKEGEDDATRVIECDATVRPKSKRILEIVKLEEKASKAKEPLSPALVQEKMALEQAMDEITSRALVFSRAKPEDKLIIVQSFQRQNHVCAMTGDGVNDGPALQRADIGVAMGNGTDVAKGASDMVLTDNNYVNIVAAVHEGRTIYCNITKFVYFLLSTNVAEVFLILFASIIGLPSPLLPTQILWLNLTTDGFPAVALAMEAGEPNIMREGPRTRQEPVIEKVMLTGVCIQTVVLTATCLATYIIGLQWENNKWNGLGVDGDARSKGFEIAQTMTIYHIVFAELLRAHGSRSMRESIFTIGIFTNKYMHMSVIASLAATFMIGSIPGVMEIFSMRYLSGAEWGLVIGLGCIPLVVDEITKCVYRYLDFGKRPIVKLDDQAFKNGKGIELDEVKVDPTA